jgi:hypothetical protein
MTPEQQQALDELAAKSLAQIQTETALTWAYRAWAAKAYATKATSKSQFLDWMNDSTEYAHEAIEHAALVGGDDVLHEVRQIIASAP